MSDTPRTDEFIGEHSEWSPAPRKNWPAFACQLERELNTANVEIERLRKANLQLREGAEEQKQRIKRLEEAGDWLCAAAAFMGWHDKIEAWNKAKEDKP